LVKIERINIYHISDGVKRCPRLTPMDGLVRMTMEIMKNLDIIHVLKGKRYLFAIELSKDKDDYQKYEDMRQEIWKEPTDRMAGARSLLGESYFDGGSSLFTGVFVEDERGTFQKDGDHMVGFSYGYVGVKDKEMGFRSLENLRFYSQYLGVKKDFQAQGLGVLIKEFQKKVVLEIFGVETITCTFDPLVGVNAYRNIHGFGMKVLEYKDACYQGFGGELNRIDVPSDRMFMVWDLVGDIRRPTYDLDDLVDSDHLVIHSRMSEIQGRSGPVRLEIIREFRTGWDRDYALVEIPFDFYTMLRETDVPDKKIRKIPLDWRLATRQVFEDLFAREYKVIDFRVYTGEERKRDFYVLKR
jgi:predicted GNAT superfamily acetyltransferase